jgi:predicted RNA-binding protein YlxR (DUF448 family)
VKRKRKIPERTCVGCRAVQPKKEMIRIVRTVDGRIDIDKTGKKSGRGAYICPNQECLELALKRNALSKSLEVLIPEEMMALLRKEFATHGK